MKKSNFKISIGVFVIILAVAYLIINGLSSTTTAYYLKVSEALNGHAEQGKFYRIEGKIDVQSATFDGNSDPVVLKFKIYDESAPEKKLTVIYNDVKPDNFLEATGAVVEGQFNPDGTFHADNLNLKCPSKYEQTDPTQEQEGVIIKFLRSIGLKK